MRYLSKEMIWPVSLGYTDLIKKVALRPSPVSPL